MGSGGGAPPAASVERIEYTRWAAVVGEGVASCVEDVLWISHDGLYGGARTTATDSDDSDLQLPTTLVDGRSGSERANGTGSSQRSSASG